MGEERENYRRLFPPSVGVKLAAPRPLSSDERFLLEWLGKEETSTFGECRGKALDTLMLLDLAERLTNDARGINYDRIALTKKGFAALSQATANSPTGGGVK